MGMKIENHEFPSSQDSKKCHADTKEQPSGQSSDLKSPSTTSYPAINNAPVPADGPGSDTFNNWLLIALLVGIPGFLTWKFCGGFLMLTGLAALTTAPILATFWLLLSALAPRKNEKVPFAGKPVESYISFKTEAAQKKYRGQNRIPMETFHEMYFAGDADFKLDALDALEHRHDWANFRFTTSLIWSFVTGMIPDLIFHTRSQDKKQIREHYDRGDDFYEWFLGERMIYTSGVISDIHTEETLEQLQDNKLAVICEKIGLKARETMLDIGCGWGTLAKFASTKYDASVTGITLSLNQTTWGNNQLKAANVPQDQSRVVCSDYRDIQGDGRWNKITCLEMAEHVGVRRFGSFLRQVYRLLDDDGVFLLQINGLRKPWQYEDLIWGLFMIKYIFPGADASTPLAWYINQLESAGFEVKSIDTIGVHYSATLWKWYQNWISNKAKVEEKYGRRWYRIWEYFLAYSTIISRQGSATCYQITLVKNINSTHRIEGVPSQFGISAALKASQREGARTSDVNGYVDHSS